MSALHGNRGLSALMAVPFINEGSYAQAKNALRVSIKGDQLRKIFKVILMPINSLYFS